MSTVRNKSRYDKEMSAVTYNMKEQRVLEKSMQTLKLEQSYALKLLELDNRIIKVHYKKLKEKVSKIKSHLPPEDISKFRDLDQRGKLKPTQSTVSLSSAIKIAAASRRLNLNSQRTSSRRSIRSALPRISVVGEDEEAPSKSAVSFSKPPVVGKLKRSNSVTGVFIDAPEPQAIQRPSSAVVFPHSNGYSPVSQNGTDMRPVPQEEEADEHHLKVEALLGNHRPTSSVNFKTNHVEEDGDHARNGATMKRASTAPHPSHSHSHSRFSSHTATEKEGKLAVTAPSPRVDQTRRLSHISIDSIDSNLGENLFEERRQELLEEESVRAATLDKRTKSFLKDIDEYLKENPPLQASHVAFEHSLPEHPRRDSLDLPPSRDPFADDPSVRQRMGRRNNDRPSEQDFMPTFFPEDKYRQRLLSLWKDMNKCRYLRLPDEKIDLSGVNTLAKDQMKLFDALRSPDA